MQTYHGATSVRTALGTLPWAWLAAFGRVSVRMIVGIVTGLFDLLCVWQERIRERRHLAGLDDHLLSDIGLNRADVEQEYDKPFWRG